MKADIMDMMFNKYETRLKDVVEYYNVPTLEHKGAAQQYYNMVKEEMFTLKHFVYELYIEAKRAELIKKRHLTKYDYIKDLEKTLDKCLNIHGIKAA